MPQTGRRKTIKKDGVEQESYTVTFTNGALQELEELKESIGAPDLNSVLKVAIGLVKRFETLRHEREQSESK